jgi:hypothetical protein
VRTKISLLGILTGVIALTPAWAADIPIAGRKLVISDKWALAGRAKIVYVGLDGRVTKGAGIDPATIGAQFEIRYGDGTTAEFILPPATETTAGRPILRRSPST